MIQFRKLVLAAAVTTASLSALTGCYARAGVGPGDPHRGDVHDDHHDEHHDDRHDEHR